MSQNFQVKDRSSLHNYRTEIPNIICCMDLNPYAFRLYFELKRIAGDEGSCFMSNKNLAARCGMKEDSITKYKRLLTEPRAIINGKSLIEIQKRKDDEGGDLPDLITINCIWEENIQMFFKGADKIAPRADKIAPPVPIESPQRRSLYKKDKYIEKTSFGEFNNIFLSKEEYLNLAIKFPEDKLKNLFEEVSRWKASNGVNKENDYAFLLSWKDFNKKNISSCNADADRWSWANKVKEKFENEVQIGRDGLTFTSVVGGLFFKFTDYKFKEKVLERLKKMKLNTEGL